VFDMIDALEAMGSDADLVGASCATLEAMLQRAGAEPAIRSAVLAGDAGMLATLLSAPMSLCPLIHPAEEEEDPEEEQDEEGEDDADDDADEAAPWKGPEPRG
jgi:hypothetical protein